jgi:hypothetical protein
MRKLLTIAILALAAACTAQAQDITGDWLGMLPRGQGVLRIVMHITKTDGSLKAVLDSPDQNMAGLVADSVSLDGNKLKWSASVAKITYEGTVKGGNSINGNWTVGAGQKIPLDFKRTTTPIKVEHAPAPPSDIDGKWEGQMNLPSLADQPGHGNVHVTFQIKNTADGLTATIDAPELQIPNWPVPSITRKGQSIKIDISQAGATYQGKLNKDLTIISGDWTTGPNYSLTLKRVKDSSADTQKAPAKN